MFITLPGMEEELVPERLRLPECTYWAAVVLSTQQPWFLLSRANSMLDGVVQTLAVSWERRLIEIVSAIGQQRIVSIKRLEIVGGADGAWEMRDLEELWLPSTSEAVETGPLLHRIHNEAQLRDCFSRPLSATHANRQILYRAPEARVQM